MTTFGRVGIKSPDLRPVLPVLLAIAGLKLVIHLYFNAFPAYGIFRDELYYLACGDHLAWGYVDHPPFSIWILAIQRALFGDSLSAIRFVPALLGSLTVFLTGLMAFYLGGGRAAVAIASFGTLSSPVILGMDTIFSMNSIDIFFWTLAGYIVLRIIQNEHPRYWLLLGVVIGLGLLNKISMLWFGFGLFAGMLLTEKRVWFATRWSYFSAAIALTIFLPYVVWNAMHGFPHLEFMRNAVGYKYSGLTPASFILGQLTVMNPFSLPIWLSGLGFFLFFRDGRRFRIIGLIWVVVFVVLMVNGHSKSEYLASAYPMIFAGGGVFIERISRKKWFGWFQVAVPVLAVTGGILFSPFALPMLSPGNYVRYTEWLGIHVSSAEGKKLAELPQFFADMNGWENMARTVSDVYRTIPAEERGWTVIFAQNYGEAGAVDYFRKRFDLPPVCSVHNNYWFWGCDEHANTYIVIGGDLEGNQRNFRSVEQTAVITSPYAIPYENNLPVYLCRGLIHPISEVWRSSRKFI